MEYFGNERVKIIKQFPNLELSYEKKSHNKVFKDICLAIPKGQKCFAWFTIYNGEPNCFILFKDFKSNRIVKVKTFLTCYDEHLCNGTIVYGTYINFKGNNLFYIEDIYQYQDIGLESVNFNEKIKYLELFFKNIKQVSYHTNFINFGMTPFHKNYKELRKIIQSSYVEIHHIQHRSLYKLEPILTTNFNNQQEERNIIKTFKIKAEIQDDIYSLYVYNNGNEIHYDTAYVSNFNTSKFLNKLFRNIKENVNLDALEESDSEEEFENINDDKYMLHKSFIMDCKYVQKFKKWEPIRVSRNNKIVTLSELKNI